MQVVDEVTKFKDFMKTEHCYNQCPDFNFTLYVSKGIHVTSAISLQLENHYDNFQRAKENTTVLQNKRIMK